VEGLVPVPACIFPGPEERIECTTQRSDCRPEGYPVLAFGTMNLFSSVVQLGRIRDAIDACLAAAANKTDQPGVLTIAPAGSQADVVDSTEERHPQTRYAHKLQAWLIDALEARPDVRFVELRVNPTDPKERSTIVVELQRDPDDPVDDMHPAVEIALPARTGEM
jgi:hypothetical protein